MQTLSIVPDSGGPIVVDEHTIYRLTAPAMPDEFFAEWLESNKEDYINAIDPLKHLNEATRKKVLDLLHFGSFKGDENTPIEELSKLHHLVNRLIAYQNEYDEWSGRLQTWVQANINWQHWYANQAVGIAENSGLSCL